jgi:hypothetical protein
MEIFRASFWAFPVLLEILEPPISGRHRLVHPLHTAKAAEQEG